MHPALLREEEVMQSKRHVIFKTKELVLHTRSDTAFLYTDVNPLLHQSKSGAREIRARLTLCGQLLSYTIPRSEKGLHNGRVNMQSLWLFRTLSYG